MIPSANKSVRNVAFAVALSSAAVLASARGASQPAVKFPADQPVPVSARVALLEQRMHRLEQRLAAFERVGLRARGDGTQELSLNGTIVVLETDGRVTITPASTGGTAPVSGRMPPASQECDPPFVYDAEGIKRFKRSCL
jgi:hypothetical protein